MMSQIYPTVLAAVLSLSILLPESSAQEYISEPIDGLHVFVPTDEHDLVAPLGKIGKAWRAAIDKGSFSKPLRGYLENPDAALHSKRRIAEHLGVKDDPIAVAAIESDWDEVAALMQKILTNWETWEQGFDNINFWSREDVEKRSRRDHCILGDTLLVVAPEAGEYGFRIRPAFLTEPLDLEAAADLKTVKPHRLDFVLDYPVGASYGEIGKKYNDLLNSTIKSSDFGLVGGSAADIYEAAYRRVLKRRSSVTSSVETMPVFFARRSASLLMRHAMIRSNRTVDAKRCSVVAFAISPPASGRCRFPNW